MLPRGTSHRLSWGLINFISSCCSPKYCILTYEKVNFTRVLLLSFYEIYSRHQRVAFFKKTHLSFKSDTIPLLFSPNSYFNITIKAKDSWNHSQTSQKYPGTISHGLPFSVRWHSQPTLMVQFYMKFEKRSTLTYLKAISRTVSLLEQLSNDQIPWLWSPKNKTKYILEQGEPSQSERDKKEHLELTRLNFILAKELPERPFKYHTSYYDNLKTTLRKCKEF